MRSVFLKLFFKCMFLPAHTFPGDRQTALGAPRVGQRQTRSSLDFPLPVRFPDWGQVRIAVSRHRSTALQKSWELGLADKGRC